MLDVGIGELLVILIVTVVVIGPKDLPLAMRTAGRWIGKMRRISAYFRSGIDAMVREAELEEMEKKWKAQNEEIMRRSQIAVTASKEPFTFYMAVALIFLVFTAVSTSALKWAERHYAIKTR